MNLRIALLVTAFAAAPLRAQAVTPPPAEAPKSELVRVALETGAGRIVVAVDPAKAPITTANFLRYVDSNRLDGINFYRAMKLWEGTGLVQAGVRDGSKLYPPIAHEPTTQTGIRHEDGTMRPAPPRAISSSPSARSKASMLAQSSRATISASPPSARSSKAWTWCESCSPPPSRRSTARKTA